MATKAQKKLNLRPLGNRVIAERAEGAEQTKSGLYVPDSAQEKPQEALIMAVGNGKTLKNGKVVPVSVKVGDRVLFGKYSGSEIKVDGNDYLILDEDEILGVLS